MNKPSSIDDFRTIGFCFVPRIALVIYLAKPSNFFSLVSFWSEYLVVAFDIGVVELRKSYKIEPVLRISVLSLNCILSLLSVYVEKNEEFSVLSFIP